MSANIPILSLDESAKRACEGKVTAAECNKVLKQFANNKSPGNDSLTIEFYQFFWPSISNILIQCFNYSHDHGELIMIIIISLIEKEGKDHQFIKNW